MKGTKKDLIVCITITLWVISGSVGFMLGGYDGTSISNIICMCLFAVLVVFKTRHKRFEKWINEPLLNIQKIDVAEIDEGKCSKCKFDNGINCTSEMYCNEGDQWEPILPDDGNCTKCGMLHLLTDDDAGSFREIERLCLSCFNQTNGCDCINGEIVCPGCNGESESILGNCAGCNGEGIRTCGKCNGLNS